MAKTIKLDHITKVEGHANLLLSIEGSEIKKCELQVVEGSRYFEGLVKGRNCLDAPEITPRICGICSCAHTVASIQAVEDALGIKPTEQTIILRELLMIGERIRSHAAHIYFLALPDYFGHDSVLSMLPKFKKEVNRALQLTKIGNKLVTLIGGREMHPISAQVGGFVKLPAQEDIDSMRKELQTVQSDAVATAKLISGLKCPNFENETEYFSLFDGQGYPMLYGDLVSKTRKFKKDKYPDYVNEYCEPYASAKFAIKEDKPFMVGALARLNNNYRYLSKNAKKVVSECKLKFPISNPFFINIAQAIELVHYVDRAIDICRKLKVVDEEKQEIEFKKGRGIGVVEVPRGLLWHDYEINDKGTILKANIMTPTSQNILNMQEDIRAFVPTVLKKKEDQIITEVERLIRAYDPCFSCSAHFLKVKFDRN